MDKDHLAHLKQEIKEIKKKIDFQRVIIAELEKDGHDTEAAITLLTTMIDALATMERSKEILQNVGLGPVTGRRP